MASHFRIFKYATVLVAVEAEATSSGVLGGVEVLQAPRGVGRGERLSPSLLGEGSGWRAVPPTQKIFRIFLLKMPYFDAF